MENEIKAISELLLTPQNPDQSYQQSEYPDILTEDEKQTVIAHHIEAEKQRVARRMAELHYPVAAIQARLAEYDFEAELDKETILRLANTRKHWKMEDNAKREEERQKAVKQREEVVKQWDANRFYNVIKRHFIEKHGKFITGAMNDHYIKTICFFLSNDPRFESELNYSFNKGLMIQGTAGLGKTETLKAVSKNPRWPVAIISILEIAETVKETGSCHIDTNRMLAIDDVGTEPEVINHYGTKVNWFKDFIESYYLNHRTYSGLIVTTNLGGDEIESRYGYRVRSRVREMFNTIQLTGKDLRQ